MTEVDTAGARPTQATASRWPRLLLLIAAAIEFLTGLSDLPILFGDLSQAPGPGIGGAVIIAKIVLHPIAAFAALFFTIRGRVVPAIGAMAATMLLTWASFLPSYAANGLEMAGMAGALTVYLMFLLPLMAVAAVVLALRGRLVPAILLAVLPTFAGVAAVIAFGIGVAIYGF